jgi:putative FmdB family regulatory protein
MPVYEYKCSKCGHITEAWQKSSDPPLHACDVCGGSVKKIISQNTFHLKGSGWYVTDYASKSSENKATKKEQKEKTPKDDSKSASNKKPGKDT